MGTEVTADDTYSCHADGTAESDNTNCDGAGLTAPTSTTVCCAAADTATCVVLPVSLPPSPPEPEPEPEDDDDNLALILGLVFGIGGGLLVIGGVWCYCKKQGLCCHGKKDKTEEQTSAAPPASASTKSQVDALKGELHDVRQQRKDLEKGAP